MAGALFGEVVNDISCKTFQYGVVLCSTESYFVVQSSTEYYWSSSL